jgi:hypothetical protein
VAFPQRNFVRLERPIMVGRDQLRIGTLTGVARPELIERFAHPPRERFFAAPVA